MLLEERHDILPELRRGALAIARPVIGEEGVPSILIHLDRHVLAGALRAAAQFFRLRHGPVLVLFAEHREERALQTIDQAQPTGRARRGCLSTRCRAWHEAAPAPDRRIGPA